MIIFGIADPSTEYIHRIAAYGIFPDHDRNMIALVRTRTGLFLPGGGVEDGEELTECLKREAIEEVGWEIQIIRKIGEAGYFFYDEPGQTYYHNEGHFYLAKKLQDLQSPVEQDHELVWLPVQEAKEKLFHKHCAWAVEQALG